MLSEEEIEKAKNNILRGNDIESSSLIMEEVIWNNLLITGGRVNIVKVAMRQILNFIEEYNDKGYVDVVREKVQLKEKSIQLEKENKKLNKMIKEMAKTIYLEMPVEFYYERKIKEQTIIGIRRYFEKKVKERKDRWKIK